MIQTEKIEKLESILGKYETWGEDEMIKISKEIDLLRLMDASTLEELSKRENNNIGTMIYSLSIGYKMTDSNSIFKSVVESIANKEDNALENGKNIVSKFIKSENVFDRCNSYLLLLSQTLTDDTMLKDLLSNKETIQKDCNELQEIALGLDTDEGLVILQSLIELIYRIQEYYFENTEENILTESDAFNKKCDEVADKMMKVLEENFNQMMLAEDAYTDLGGHEENNEETN